MPDYVQHMRAPAALPPHCSRGFSLDSGQCFMGVAGAKGPRPRATCMQTWLRARFSSLAGLSVFDCGLGWRFDPAILVHSARQAPLA